MSGILGTVVVGILSIAFISIAILVAISLLILNRHKIRKNNASHLAFPCTRGRITATGVREGVRMRPDDDPFYHAYVDFEYQVDGRSYTGNQGIGRSYNLESEAGKILGKWPVGSEVTVRYNPANPDDAKMQESRC